MVSINSAESNRASIRYLPEVVWATTPATGVSKEMRITSSSMVAGKETKTSEEIRADRMVPNIIEVAAMSSGDINFEFSAGSLDDFLASFLLGSWTEPMSHLLLKGANVSLPTTGIVRLAGADYTDWISATNQIKLEGFLNAANNGYFTVASVSFTGGNTDIVVSEATPFVVEVGSAYTKFMDAGDVILRSATTTFTAGNVVNGGGASSFAGKIIRPGQKVFIDSILGKETGTITFNVSDTAAGDTISVTDGVNLVTFEFDTVVGNINSGNIFVLLDATPATQAELFRVAVMNQFAKQAFRVSATIAAAVITLTNHRFTSGAIVASDAGDSVTVAAFSGGTLTKGGFFTVASVPDNDTFVTVETLTADTNASSNIIVIKGSHLRNPATGILKQSYTIETGFGDVSKYFVMRGMRPGSFSLSIASGELVTGSISFMGKDTVASSTQALNNVGLYDVRASTATEVFNATSNVGQIELDGVTLQTAIKSIEISGDASLREQRAVGEKFPAGIGYGRFTLSGSIMAYFENFDFYNTFINHTTISLGFTMEDVDHYKYFFRIPAVKIKTDPISPGGIDQDIMEEMDWEAQRDPIYDTMFMVDRFSSVWPTTDAL